MTARPKFGSPTGTSTRIQPAPLQVGQALSGAVGLVPAPFGRGRWADRSAFPSRCTGLPSFGSPALEDALDVPPASLIVSDRLAEGVLDPAGRVQLGGLTQLVGDQRLDQADARLVQREDARALSARPGDARPGERR